MMSLYTCIARQVNRFCLLQNWLSAELKGAIHNSHEFHLQSSVWTSSSQWDWKLSHEMGANGQPVKDGAQTFSKPWNCTALRKRRQEHKRSRNVECNESTLLPSLKRDLLLCGVFRFYDKKQREGENNTLSLTDTLVDDILFFSAAVATKRI